MLRLGMFEPTVADQRAIKIFKAYGDLIVTAGVEYESAYNKKLEPEPNIVHLAIAAASKESENIFGSVESSEASTGFRKRWNLTTSKKISSEGKVYTFTLGCSEGVELAK